MKKTATILGCLISLSIFITSVSADSLTVDQSRQLPYVETVTRSYDECRLDSFESIMISQPTKRESSILSIKDAEEYYGSQLDANARAFYDQIGSNLEKTYDGRTPINIDCANLSLTKENWEEAFVRGVDAFFADHPEVFWLESGCLSASASKLSTSPYYTAVILRPQQDSYYLPADRTGNKQQFSGVSSVNAARLNLEAIADSCLSQIPANASDYDKLKAIHDWLANRVDYDLAYSDQGLYSAMFLERGVCAGYKDSFNYLARKAGIESISVAGVGYSSATHGENHAWNLVRLDGAWYGVDVTWDDQTEKQTKKIYDDYFLVGSESVPKMFSYQVPFSVSHRVRNYLSDSRYSFQVPTMNKTAYVNKPGKTEPPVNETPTPGTQPPAPITTKRPEKTEPPVSETPTPGTQPPAPITTKEPEPSQPPVNETPTPVLAGDVNGDGYVNLDDARLALSLALGISTEHAIVEAADVDGNIGVTLLDAEIILKMALAIPF